VYFQPGTYSLATKLSVSQVLLLPITKQKEPLHFKRRKIYTIWRETRVYRASAFLRIINSLKWLAQSWQEEVLELRFEMEKAICFYTQVSAECDWTGDIQHLSDPLSQALFDIKWYKLSISVPGTFQGIFAAQTLLGEWLWPWSLGWMPTPRIGSVPGTTKSKECCLLTILKPEFLSKH
jgi:hypothetical protein